MFQIARYANVQKCSLTKRQPIFGPLNSPRKITDNTVDYGPTPLRYEGILWSCAEELLLASATINWKRDNYIKPSFDAI